MKVELETRALGIHFGGHVAVDAVSCVFTPGQLTAIVGPNGAGKTTYFNLISGQLKASMGRVLFNGTDITRTSVAARARAGIGRAFQLTNLFPGLTVAENVRLAIQAAAGVHYDLWRPWTHRRDLIVRADDVLERVALTNRRDVVAAALSHGDQRKLEVGLMIALEPQIFMFDEPTAGMSIDEVPVVLDLIARLKEDRSKIVLLVEHKMKMVMGISERIVVLHHGELIAEGTPDDIRANDLVKRVYLGQGGH